MRWILLVLALIPACTTYSRAALVPMPDGQNWWTVDCRHRVQCIQDANARCENGWYEYRGEDKHQRSNEFVFRCTPKKKYANPEEP